MVGLAASPIMQPSMATGDMPVVGSAAAPIMAAPVAVPPMTLATAQPMEQCRVCHGIGGELIAPCLCDGAQKFLHRKCLDQYRAVMRNTSAFTHCEQCSFEYWLQIRPDRQRSRRKLKFRALVMGHTMLIFLLIQLLICSLGYVVHLADTRTLLCTKYVLCAVSSDCAEEATRGLDTCTSPAYGAQAGDCPSGATCRAMGKLRYRFFVEEVADHEKATYYACGFLWFFAMLGLFGCINGLATKEQRKQPDYDPVADCDCVYCFLCYSKQERGWVAAPPPRPSMQLRTAGDVESLPSLTDNRPQRKRNNGDCCPADCACTPNDQDACCGACHCCCEAACDGTCLLCCHGCAECAECCANAKCDCNFDGCGGAGGGDCNEAAAVLLAVAIVLLIFFAFVGFLYGLVLGSALLQRVVQRHYHVLQRRLLAKDYVVLDLRQVDLSAFAQQRQAIVINVPSPADADTATATVVGLPQMVPPQMAPMAPVYDKLELQRLLGNV